MSASNGETSPPGVDLVIVGAGPIGLEVAAAAARAGLSHLVLDAGEVGHTMTWWAPQTRWFSSNDRIAVAGMPLVTPDGTKATREQYLAYLRGVVQGLGLHVRTFERVVDVEGEAGDFTVVSRARQHERRTRCRAVVLAVGGTDFPNKLGVEGDDLPHVDGFLREPHKYYGRRVLIIGGRNSAIEAALRCHHAGADVSLSYRGDELPTRSIKYWLLPEIEGLMKSGAVTPHLGTTVRRITPTHVELDRGGKTVAVEADDVLSLIGYGQDKRLLRRIGVELVGDEEKPSYDEATMRTSVPGVYVAGTAIAGTQSSKYRVFLENCHDHAGKIVADVVGGASSAGASSADPRLELKPAGDRAVALARRVAEQPES